VAHDPAAFEAWRVDPSAGAPGGESLDALLERSARWLEEPTEEHRSVVIADGSFIRAVVVHVLRAGPEAFWRMDVRPLSTTVLSSDGTRWQVRSLGATTHPASETG
jgi:broad specificity phosphatase PhoE